MLEAFAKHLNAENAPVRCVVGLWVETLDDDSKKAFKQLMDKKVASEPLYRDLINSGQDIPFKTTSFRLHMRGFCICQK